MSKKIILPIVIIVIIVIAAVVLYQKGMFNSKPGSPNEQMQQSEGTQSQNNVGITDQVVGSGAEAVTGDLIMVHYTGMLEDGTIFDTSYARMSPFVFRLGEGSVIQGWEDGVVGMKAGGKRTLVIPSELAYGATGSGDVIPPNATLKFEIELLGIEGKQSVLVDEDALTAMNSDAITSSSNEISEEDVLAILGMPTSKFTHRGALKDVTNSQVIRNINTQGAASGVAEFGFADNVFSVRAIFRTLPAPSGDDYYEGWIVRKNPLSVVSTGKVSTVEGVYENAFTSDVDYSDHTFYVLTLEPNDNDPAPADHILEGALELIQ